MSKILLVKSIKNDENHGFLDRFRSFLGFKQPLDTSIDSIAREHGISVVDITLRGPIDWINSHGCITDSAGRHRSTTRYHPDLNRYRGWSPMYILVSEDEYLNREGSLNGQVMNGMFYGDKLKETTEHDNIHDWIRKYR